MARTMIILLMMLMVIKTMGEYCAVATCEKSGCIIDYDVFEAHTRTTGDIGIVFGITSGFLCGIVMLGGAFITAEVLIVYGR